MRRVRRPRLRCDKCESRDRCWRESYLRQSPPHLSYRREWRPARCIYPPPAGKRQSRRALFPNLREVPQTPPIICSSSEASVAELPFPGKPNLTGKCSAASSIRARFHALGVQVVAFVSVAGPVPPIIEVVSAERTS